MRTPVLDIVIVDYNSGSLVQACLISIASHLPRNAILDRVVVVDNASRDATDYHDGRLGLPLYVIRNPHNLGFAAACNQGAAGGSADYVLFLNPDTRLLDGSLDIPIDFMEEPQNCAVGIVGIQLLDDEGRLSRTCSYFPKLTHFINKVLGLDHLSPRLFSTGFMACWDHASTRRVDVVIGAFFFVRRSVFELLQGFDERFFVYFEEGEFALRALQHGYETYYLDGAQAYHPGGGASNQVKAQRLYYSLQSRIRYGYKHFGWVAATILLLVTLFIEPFSRIVLSFAQKSRSGIAETVQGYAQLWRSLLNIAG